MKYLDDNQAVPRVPVCRFAHPSFSQLISEYVLAQVINAERGFARKMVQAQIDKQWIADKVSHHRGLNELKIGILGVGQMGKFIAKTFKVESLMSNRRTGQT